MNFVLFFAAMLALSGPVAEGPFGFETLEECEKMREKALSFVEEHNASPNPDKILVFAAVCAQSKAAPQGKQL